MISTKLIRPRKSVSDVTKAGHTFFSKKEPKPRKGLILNLELTQELLDPFIGGQAKIQDLDLSVYWGEIKDIRIKGYGLVISFSWLAKKPDHTSRQYDWTLEEEKNEHRSNTSFLVVGRMAHDQVLIKSPVTDEYIVLLPKDYESKLKLESLRSIAPSAG